MLCFTLFDGADREFIQCLGKITDRFNHVIACCAVSVRGLLVLKIKLSTGLFCGVSGIQQWDHDVDGVIHIVLHRFG